MSVSLVVIRLELADDCKPLKAFSYSSGEISILFFLSTLNIILPVKIDSFMFYVDQFGTNPVI